MEMRLQREMSALSSLLTMSEEFCRLNGLTGPNRETIDFVLEELFTNAVKYGSSDPGEILVVLDRRQDEFHLSVTDFDADRFDPRELPEVEVGGTLEERHPGGLGIHLLRKFADRIEYEHHDRTSRITIYKRLE